MTHAIRSYSLVLPEGWRRLPVRDDSEPVLRSLVDEAFADLPRDRAAPFRAEVLKALRAQLTAARTAAALDLYLPVVGVGGRPAAASFVVSHLPTPPGEEVGASEIADVLVDSHHGTDTAVRAEAIGGQEAVRLDWVEPPDLRADEPLTSLDRSTRHVDYVVPVPQGAGHLLISFSTAVLLDQDSPTSSPNPQARFDDLLVSLFDAVVATLRWRTA